MAQNRPIGSHPSVHLHNSENCSMSETAISPLNHSSAQVPLSKGGAKPDLIWQTQITSSKLLIKISSKVLMGALDLVENPPPFSCNECRTPMDKTRLYS